MEVDRPSWRVRAGIPGPQLRPRCLDLSTPRPWSQAPPSLPGFVSPRWGLALCCSMRASLGRQGITDQSESEWWGYQPMTLDVALLETSFDLIAPRADVLVDRFYSRLFQTAPSTRQLFERVDMDVQKQSLVATLVSVREALRDLTTIVPDLEDLGEQHVGYGARPEH